MLLPISTYSYITIYEYHENQCSNTNLYSTSLFALSFLFFSRGPFSLSISSLHVKVPQEKHKERLTLESILANIYKIILDLTSFLAHGIGGRTREKSLSLSLSSLGSNKKQMTHLMPFLSLNSLYI